MTSKPQIAAIYERPSLVACKGVPKEMSAQFIYAIH
ncbi:hypothetical protein EYZ11_012522 [Aspergillus tanneri]|uniref:Uncharacterized protein n=1 Tax=Aspergillus tanneri TaxID=1220188 RepID=A0A4S3J5F3_9EURO|nr:hypothetical protein EYZ11_012522 [Aspergillus tanneri]